MARALFQTNRTMPKENNNKNIVIALAACVAFLLIVFIGTFVSARLRKNEEVSANINTFQDVRITAKSAYVIDIKKNTVMYAKEPETQLPMASLTKIMSAIVATEEAPENLVVKTADELLPERGGGDIYANEEWRLKDIVDFALTTSSNDAVAAIASAVGSLETSSQKNPEEVFVEKMNSKARALGLYQTYFINPSGLDISPSFSGAYGSAKDVARLISYAYLNYPHIMEATAEENFTVQSLSGLLHNVSNTNEIAGNLPGLAASKTGFTDLAGGNLAVVLEAGPGRPIAIAVMGGSKEGRFDDINKLYGASLKYIDINHE